MRVVRARCCARNLRSRNGARCPKQFYQVNQRANIDVGSRLETYLGANPAIEHPCRNLKTALRHRTADTAAENVHVHPLDGLMNVNVTAGPRMPPIENLANIGPVGVPSPRCTIPSVRTAVWATAHRPRKLVDRQCRPPVPLHSTSGQHWRWRGQCTNNQHAPLSGRRLNRRLVARFYVMHAHHSAAVLRFPKRHDRR